MLPFTYRFAIPFSVNRRDPLSIANSAGTCQGLLVRYTPDLLYSPVMNASKSTVVFEDTDYASGQRRLIAVVIDLCVCFTLMAIPMLIATYLWVAPEHQVKLDDAAKQRRLVFEDIGAEILCNRHAVRLVAVFLPDRHASNMGWNTGVSDRENSIDRPRWHSPEPGAGW